MSSYKEEHHYFDDTTNNCNDNVHNIPNLHPSRRGSLVAAAEDCQDYHGYNYNDEEPILASSFKNKIETFVGSYSRTSMMHMAENVVVSSNASDNFHHTALLDEEENSLSYTKNYTSSIRYSLPTSTLSIHSRRNSEGTLHDERTPLLFPTTASLHKVNTNTSVYTIADSYIAGTSQQDHHFHGSVQKSSFIQSIFNSINILVGVGVLALPLGFKCAGWLIGFLIFAFCFGLTNYTAKLLAKCLDLDPNSRTYGDMGASAFGVKGRIFISILFLTELTTASVALVVLLSDGIDSLFPGHNPFLNRVISYIILTPTLFIPVRHLSFTSLLGILSALSLLVVILYDGFSKPHAPGSLHELAEVRLFPEDWMTVPMSFGLIMAGFAGHAVFPTIYRDMAEPRKYKKMVNYTYVATAIIYMAVAAAGYAMFGSETMQEITQNIVSLPGYNQTLNRLAVWLIALNPIAKYGLTLNPVILSWQIGLFGTNNGNTAQSKLEGWFHESSWRIPLVKTIGVSLTSAMIVLLAGMLPNFDQVMSLLGALFSFLISGIFPICCYLKLFRSSLSSFQKMLNYSLLGVAACMATIGTVRSFI
ncbi:transmembrane amino acid transporter protein-domain-containing protein [Mycotypha africana]|uniref:transmembrane amino acid transporter protein-domain-containing protein n=1 Tax=Mycotypha africana TaxID=64632 RepID=UPI002301CF4A|nr:transmembrane amino acid transporter protein-domain-containing protein [Mycotypha africana]KAI8991436.1 transmembrane amino acid transporter protein-domain-containing protein [Mycotypha africana]